MPNESPDIRVQLIGRNTNGVILPVMTEDTHSDTTILKNGNRLIQTLVKKTMLFGCDTEKRNLTLNKNGDTLQFERLCYYERKFVSSAISTYDPAGRLVQTTEFQSASTSPGYYDSRGFHAPASYRGQVRYAYDDNGRLKTVAHFDNTKLAARTVYTYGIHGMVESVDSYDGNGNWTNREYYTVTYD